MEIEARGHTTSYRRAGITLRRKSSDVIMAVNGLTARVVAAPKSRLQSINELRFTMVVVW